MCSSDLKVSEKIDQTGTDTQAELSKLDSANSGIAGSIKRVEERIAAIEGYSKLMLSSIPDDAIDGALEGDADG